MSQAVSSSGRVTYPVVYEFSESKRKAALQHIFFSPDFQVKVEHGPDNVVRIILEGD
jgi:hypothetical protein